MTKAASKLKFVYDFARPSVTATVIIFHRTSGKFLTGKRSKTTSAFPDTDSLPGGFLDARIDGRDVPSHDPKVIKSLVRPGETVEQAALREIGEETNLHNITEDRLVQYYVCSDPELDPRCHVVNVCFYVVVDDEDLETLEAGDDLQSVDWEFCTELFNPSYTLAFNHADLAKRGYNAWKDRLELEQFRLAQRGLA